MARDYTTDGLIEYVKDLVNVEVATGGPFTPASVIRRADFALQSMIVPLVRENRKTHFVRYEDVTMTSATEYDIPEEALNRGVYNVATLNTDGDPSACVYVDFDREIDVASYWGELLRRTPGLRLGYYTRGDKLHVYPESRSGETLRIYFERLPNRLVDTDEAGQVTAVDSGTGIVTCSSIPSTWATGDSACCVQGDPGFDLRFSARAFTDVTSPTVTFSDVTGIEVGDWIALEGDSPVLQIPVETHPILAQATAHLVLKSQGDPATVVEEQRYTEMALAYRRSYPRRTENEHERVYSRNRLADYVRMR